MVQPFHLDDYQAGQFVGLLRNDNYWKGLPRMEEVVVDMGQVELAVFQNYSLGM